MKLLLKYQTISFIEDITEELYKGEQEGSYFMNGTFGSEAVALKHILDFLIHENEPKYIFGAIKKLEWYLVIISSTNNKCIVKLINDFRLKLSEYTFEQNDTVLISRQGLINYKIQRK